MLSSTLKQMMRGWNCSEPASKDAIQQLLSNVPPGIILPKDYIDFLSHANGAQVGWETLDAIHSVDEAIAQSKEYGFAEGSLLIFATTGGGDAFCFANVAGRTRITHHSLDEVPHPAASDVVADTFEAFINQAKRTQKGQKAVAGKAPAKKTIKRADRRTQALVLPAVVGQSVVLPSHQDRIASLAVSPSGNILASASHDGTIRLVDLESGGVLKELKTPKAKPLSLRFSKDGAHLFAGLMGVSGSKAARAAVDVIRVFDLATASIVSEYKGHDGGVSAIDVSPDGALLASTGNDSTVQVFNTADGKIVGTWKVPSRGLCLAWSPDGAQLAVACFRDKDSALLTFDTSGKQKTKTKAPWDCNVLLFAGDDAVLAGGHLLKLPKCSLVWKQDTPPLRAAAFDERQNLFFCAHAWDSKPGIVVRTKAEGSESAHYNTPAALITAMALALDQRFIVTGDVVGELRLWRRLPG